MSKLIYLQGSKKMDSSFINKIVTWIPLGGAIVALGRWIFQLKGDIKDAHERIDDLEEEHNRLQDKIDRNMEEINRRIDDCKNSILASVNAVLQAISKS